MLAWIKRTSVELSVGAAVGFVVWCLLGKWVTSIMFGSLGGSINCSTDVEKGLDKFVSMQLYSAIGGALFAVVTMVIARRLWSKARARLARPPQTAIS
jgi:hypothetical protein